MSEMLEISTLGGLQIRRDGAPVGEFASRKAEALLVYLACTRRPQAREVLADLLWDERAADQALANLRALLSNLRRYLAPHLLITRETVGFNTASNYRLDVTELEAALATLPARGRGSRLAPADVEHLEQVARLYHGDFLHGFYVRGGNGFEEWMVREQERLQRLTLLALQDLVSYYLAAGDYPAGIGHARRLLELDPLREETHRQMMLLLVRNGQRRTALAQFDACRRILDAELGVIPAPETRALYECIRTGGLCETEGETLVPIAVPRPEVTRAVARPRPPVERAPLVGRAEEWARLLDIAKRHAAQPHLAVLAGDAGIGKTRLAEELLAWADREGIVTATARSYAAEGALAYSPVRGWLRTPTIQAGLAQLDGVWFTEVTRLVPELLVERPNLPPPGPLAETWQRQRLFEALARVLTGDGSRRVLLLDDLQWCDRESLEWLRYLMRRDDHAPVLIVGTLREEDVVADHPLTSFLLELRRNGQVTELPLGALDRAETSALASQVTGEDLDPAIAGYLYAETEGNPLFVVETARAGILTQRGGAVDTYLTPAPLAVLPPTVQAVIQSRLAGLSGPARDLVRLAAVIGRAFAFDVLAVITGREEESLLRDLDELCRRRILREQGAAIYDFMHDKLREVAYVELSYTRRRALHARVAHTLEGLNAADLDSVSGLIAGHYKRARLTEKAIPYYQRAAATAMRMQAPAAALDFLRRAIALLDATPAVELPADWRAAMLTQLPEQQGDMLLHMGQPNAAHAAYVRALAATAGRDGAASGRLAAKIGVDTLR
ncbi:MAG TPA: BTAD domain-containing putative transcriptional regulator [Chloroflexia bacterium]|nr:BTAD domain-containing putative transcriptional regulator [Chloroflexia bacterium]